MLDSTLEFEFVVPSQIVFGWGRRRDAGLLARSLGKRAFVVCGSRTLEQSAEWTGLFDSLRDAGVEAVPLCTISREPLVEDVDETLARLRALRADSGDLLLGFGGGSAIDLAKGAAALVTNRPGGSVREYLEGVGSGLTLVEPPLPLLAIPTTAGTGAEATKNAVISSCDPPFKKSLRSARMIPRIALIDPELTTSVSPRVTAWSGMDAITQLIESAISRRATPATWQLAMDGLAGAVPMLLEAFHHGTSRAARTVLSRAALLSGVALANSGLGMAHGVAAALGVHCQTPHGLACATLLPLALRANLSHPETVERLAMLAPRVLEEFEPGRHPLASREASLALVERIERLLGELKIPRRLSELGVARDQIPAIVRDSRGNSMSANPRDIGDGELTWIIEEAW
jgi:alcohol dehydrogenase class IV